MNVRLLAIGLAISVLPCGAPPAVSQEAPLPELEKRITLEHRGKFKDFVERLRTSLGVNIFVHPKAKDEADLDVERELLLREVTGESALRWVTWLYQLEYVVQGGGVVIGRPGRLRAPVLRGYDVRHLLANPKDCDGAHVALLQGPGNTPQSVGFSVTTSEAVEKSLPSEYFIDLLKENIAPGTWEGAATAEFSLDRRLVVNHTLSVHHELLRFLDALGQLSPPMVTVTAEIFESDEASAPLTRPGSSSQFTADELGAVLNQLASAKKSPAARVMQCSGTAGQRLHAILMDESATVEGLHGKDPVVATGIDDVSVLDCRPILVGDGKYISIETRLTIGQSTDLDPVKTKNGDLTFREATLTKVRSTFLIPNGGGALFALPARSTSAKKGQLCLLRASSDPTPPLRPREIVMGGTRPGEAALVERLKKVPPVSVDLEDVSFDDFLKWLRGTSGLNVVADEAARSHRVTVHGKNLNLPSILTLVLEPEGLHPILRDEALLIATTDLGRKEKHLALLDVRDVSYGVREFPRPGIEEAKQQFTGEDLANLIKNTVDKSAWEEADGNSIQYDRGILFVRNSIPMINQVLRFVDDHRRSRLRTVTLRADTLLVPAAAAEPILQRAGGDTCLIDEKQYEALMRAGKSQEHLSWTCFESQRTAMSWERSVGYLRDWNEAGDSLSDAYPTQSYLDVRPTLSEDGRSFTLDLEYEDRRLTDINAKMVRDLLLQTPLSSGVQMKTLLRVPGDRMALFKWSAPTKGPERQVRLLILKPSLWQEGK